MMVKQSSDGQTIPW